PPNFVLFNAPQCPPDGFINDEHPQDDFINDEHPQDDFINDEHPQDDFNQLFEPPPTYLSSS
ncbi:hypothetical protein H0H87_010320, partial [Tephrocybe sp. NHM501043]